ncbi:hypothetical protein BDF22DRAFT_678427 [Syncephalis plumigaleata]|nr:hypothetical protein BDF22DRAFT_678427 [Syncephalis plumigaleata]
MILLVTRHAPTMIMSNTPPSAMQHRRSRSKEEEEESTTINRSNFKKLTTRRLKSSMHYERHGVHNLAHFTNRVTNKSMIECASYLASIQRAMMELYHGLEQSGSLHLWNIYPWQHPTARCIPEEKVLKEEKDAEILARTDDDIYRVFIQKSGIPVMDKRKTLLMLELFHLRHALTLSQYVFYRHQPDCQVAIGYDTFTALYIKLRNWLTKLIGHIITLANAKQVNNEASRSLSIDWKIVKLALELRGDPLNRRSFLERMYNQLYEEDVIDELPDELTSSNVASDESKINWVDVERLARLRDSNPTEEEEPILTDERSTFDTNEEEGEDEEEYHKVLKEEQELEDYEQKLDEEYDNANEST